MRRQILFSEMWTPTLSKGSPSIPISSTRQKIITDGESIYHASQDRFILACFMLASQRCPIGIAVSAQKITAEALHSMSKTRM
jgi:hypothetical protein